MTQPIDPTMPRQSFPRAGRTLWEPAKGAVLLVFPAPANTPEHGTERESAASIRGKSVEYVPGTFTQPRSQAMADATQDLTALAARYPEHADLIRVIKAQMVTAARAPESQAVRSILAANVERLRAALGGR